MLNSSNLPHWSHDYCNNGSNDSSNINIHNISNIK
jgi:hypothetical protein